MFSKFRKKSSETNAARFSSNLQTILMDFSIEVMPKMLSKIEDITSIIPKNTRVYIAHLEGCKIEDMIASAKKLNDDGFKVMPHIPARLIESKAALDDLIERYQGEANVTEALILAGGRTKPVGEFESSIDLLKTEVFGKNGFKHLHIAGHPEGNMDIDKDGSDKIVMEALEWKQKFADSSDADMAIVTQFVFSAAPVIEWSKKIQAAGINLPIHVGLASPAKIQTLIKYAIACGVGPSMKILQKRATDVTKLLLPYEPTEVAEALASHMATNTNTNIKKLHIFPLGGIKNSANWANINN